MLFSLFLLSLMVHIMFELLIIYKGVNPYNITLIDDNKISDSILSFNSLLIYRKIHLMKDLPKPISQKRNNILDKRYSPLVFFEWFSHAIQQ